jgi:hypothetical protein
MILRDIAGHVAGVASGIDVGDRVITPRVFALITFLIARLFKLLLLIINIQLL